VSLTRSEVSERAAKIWGEGTVLDLVYKTADDQWDVKLQDHTWHSIDGNGHTSCHPTCAKREDISFATPIPKGSALDEKVWAGQLSIICAIGDADGSGHTHAGGKATVTQEFLRRYDHEGAHVTVQIDATGEVAYELLRILRDAQADRRLPGRL
jgi:hypothetical protein